ncbi:hypothetical protein OF846_003561 [Rhodotorula toruloides]|nr:hypothetical protein OF846_003561 [Rhodotorula toruloides]
MQFLARHGSAGQMTCYEWRISVPLAAVTTTNPLDSSVTFPDLGGASCSCTFSLRSANGFEALWTAQTSGPSLATDALSSAEFYWTTEDGQNGALVSSVVGQIRQEWPNETSQSLSLTVLWAVLEHAAAVSDGQFISPTHSFFLLRLRFTSVAPLGLAAPGRRQNTGAMSAQDEFRLERLADMQTSPLSHDVRLCISTTGSSAEYLWADSRTLSHFSAYFRDLFPSGFNDANKRTLAEHSCETVKVEADDNVDAADDSDAEDAEMTEAEDTTQTSLPPDWRFYSISIPGFSRRTWRVVLLWMSTSTCLFAPLKSSPSSTSSESTNSSSLAASPKSVYRLAHYLRIPPLTALALTELQRQLSPSIAAIELFASATVEFDEIREVVVAYTIAHWDEVVKTSEYKDAMDKCRRGELALSGPLTAALLPYLLRPA